MAGKGRQKGAQADQWWKDAIRLVAAEETTGDDGVKVKKLRRVAAKLFDAAMDGDVAAMKEIGDRLDGRPRQQVDMSHEGGVTVNIAARHDGV